MKYSCKREGEGEMRCKMLMVGGEIGLSFSYLLYAISFAFVLKLNFMSDKYAFDTEGYSNLRQLQKPAE
jgi:hypothetical protein